MSETSTTPATSDAGRSERRAEQQRSASLQAWAVVVTLTVIATLVIVDFAFSTSNDSQSVDGRTATSSQYVDG